MAHTASKSFVQSLAVAVIGGGHVAENAAKNVSVEGIISGTQELSDDAKSTLQGWLNESDSA